MHLVRQLPRSPIPPNQFLVLARLVVAAGGGFVPAAARSVQHEPLPQDVVHQYQPSPLQNAVVPDQGIDVVDQTSLVGIDEDDVEGCLGGVARSHLLHGCEGIVDSEQFAPGTVIDERHGIACE